jgi:hypothetical protein
MEINVILLMATLATNLKKAVVARFTSNKDWKLQLVVFAKQTLDSNTILINDVELRFHFAS